MKIKTAVLTSLLVGCLSASGLATTFVVSTTGNDEADGSEATPFASIARARDVAREALKRGEPVEILIHGGTYELIEPLVLGPLDSGTEKSPVIWRAAQGEEVRLSAGRLVKGWMKVTDPAVLEQLDPTARERVQEIHLSKLGVTDFGEISGGFGQKGSTGLEVFADDVPMQLSRYPNEGFITVTDVSGPPMKNRAGNNEGSVEGVIKVKDSRIARWAKEKDPQALGYWAWDWAEGRQKIAKIDPEKLIISLAPPRHQYGYRKDQYFYGFNLLCEIDEPGEWYLDRETGILYLLPPDGKTPERTLVSLLPLVVDIKDATHVTFRNLIFEGARDDAIRVRESTGIQVVGCTLRNCGKSGVRVTSGTHCQVRGCDIYGTGDGGVILIGGDRAKLTPGAHVVENCHIHHYSRWNRTYQPGIKLTGVGNRAAHNLIHDAPHQAMDFAGNDHLIEFNEIHNVCTETNDAGAIYAWNDWTYRGNQLRYNYIHRVYGRGAGGAKGIYLDDNMSSAAIFGNIFEEVSQPVFLGGGRDHQVINNIFVACPSAIHIDARGLDWRKDGLEVLRKKLEYWPIRRIPWSTRYPELGRLLGNKPMAPVGIVVTRNIMISSNWNDIAGNALPFVKLENNLLNAPIDLLINKPDTMPRINEQAPDVLAIKFQAIPYDKIGLIQDADRASWPAKHPAKTEKWASNISTTITANPKVPAKVPRLNRIPNADGVIKPNEYSGQSLDLAETPERKKLETPSGKMWLAHDGKWLYVAISIPVTKPPAVSPTATWGQFDGVELAFAADKKGAPTFILRGFLDGRHLESLDAGAPINQSLNLNKTARFAAKTSETSWIAEWAIPLDVAGISVQPNRALRFNATVRRMENEDWIVWAGTGRETWRVEGAGQLILE